MSVWCFVAQLQFNVLRRQCCILYEMSEVYIVTVFHWSHVLVRLINCIFLKFNFVVISDKIQNIINTAVALLYL